MSNLRVRRTKNAELIREALSDPRLWRVVAQDGEALEDFDPAPEVVTWLALLDEDTLRGFLLAIPRSRIVTEVHIAIKPEFWGDSKTNVALGKLACEWVRDHTGARKLVAQIPTTDKHVLRYAQRCGFQREGVNKKSYLRGGELLDQFHLGRPLET